MKGSIENFKKSDRKTVFAELDQFDVTAEKHGFIEVTMWTNYEGMDVEINSHGVQRFQLTFGQFDALKMAVKALDKL